MHEIVTEYLNDEKESLHWVLTPKLWYIYYSMADSILGYVIPAEDTKRVSYHIWLKPTVLVHYVTNNNNIQADNTNNYFWNRHDIMSQLNSVPAPRLNNIFCYLLWKLKNLCCKIKRKYHGMFIPSVLLFHNAWTHFSDVMQDVITLFPLINSDSVSTNFFLFLQLKHFLDVCVLITMWIKTEVTKLIMMPVADFYKNCIQATYKINITSYRSLQIDSLINNIHLFKYIFVFK